MRIASGARNTRFHHLRHSVGTFSTHDAWTSTHSLIERITKLCRASNDLGHAHLTTTTTNYAHLIQLDIAVKYTASVVYKGRAALDDPPHDRRPFILAINPETISALTGATNGQIRTAMSRAGKESKPVAERVVLNLLKIRTRRSLVTERNIPALPAISSAPRNAQIPNVLRSLTELASGVPLDHARAGSKLTSQGFAQLIDVTLDEAHYCGWSPIPTKAIETIKARLADPKVELPTQRPSRSNFNLGIVTPWFNDLASLSEETMTEPFIAINTLTQNYDWQPNRKSPQRIRLRKGDLDRLNTAIQALSLNSYIEVNPSDNATHSSIEIHLKEAKPDRRTTNTIRLILFCCRIGERINEIRSADAVEQSELAQ